MRIFVILCLAGALAACDGTNSETTSSTRDAAPSTEVDSAPDVDADPTPQTSTGGDSQSATPERTVNGTSSSEPSPSE